MAYDGKHVCIGCGIAFIDKKHKDRKYCTYRCAKINDRNPNWNGDNAGYIALHVWISVNLPGKGVCAKCNKLTKTDAHNINGDYKRNLSGWEWLCRTCHMKKDGRLKKMIERNNSKKILVGKKCFYCNDIFYPKKSVTIYCSRKCYFNNKILRKEIT